MTILTLSNQEVGCFTFFCVRGEIGCGQKGFTLMWQCHQLLSGFLAKGHLLRVSRQSRRSRRSLNDKGDNEKIPGAVHRSPGIYLSDKENPGKPQLGTFDEGCATNHRLKWGPTVRTCTELLCIRSFFCISKVLHLKSRIFSAQ